MVLEEKQGEPFQQKRQLLQNLEHDWEHPVFIF